jgi:hypothetical protein
MPGIVQLMPSKVPFKLIPGDITLVEEHMADRLLDPLLMPEQDLELEGIDEPMAQESLAETFTGEEVVE